MFAECVACTDVKRPPGYASVVTHANLTERFNRNPPLRIPALVDRRRALVGLDVPIDTEELHRSLSEGTCEPLEQRRVPGGRIKGGGHLPNRSLSWDASRGPLQWRHERRFRMPPHTAAAYPHSGSDARPVRSGATRLAQVLLRPKSIRARRASAPQRPVGRKPLRWMQRGMAWTRYLARSTGVPAWAWAAWLQNAGPLRRPSTSPDGFLGRSRPGRPPADGAL